MQNFKELKVWHPSVDLAVDITIGFPAEEKYGLVSQMRKASVSMLSNIAECTGRRTNKDFNNFPELRLVRLMNWKRSYYTYIPCPDT